MNHLNHEEYEILVMKAVDGQLSAQEQAQLEQHLQSCKDCREELHDFQAIKASTDFVRQRILTDAAYEPLREPALVRAWNRLNFVFVALGCLFLLSPNLRHGCSRVDNRVSSQPPTAPSLGTEP